MKSLLLVATGLLILFFKGSEGACGITQSFTVDEVEGEIATIPITNINSFEFADPTIGKYFARTLIPDVSLTLTATAEFPNFVRENVCSDCDTTCQTNNNPLEVSIIYTLTCSDATPPLPIPITISIRDSNEDPEFSSGKTTFPISLPSKGSPFNWDDPIIVKDGDYNNDLTTYTFEVSDRADIAVVSFKRFTSPTPTGTRLKYYEVYLGVTDGFTGEGMVPFTLTATLSGATPGSYDHPLALEVQRSSPVVEEISNYNQDPFENTVDNEIEVAYVGDGSDPSDLVLEPLEGVYASNFDANILEVTGTRDTVQLTLVTPLTAVELRAVNHVIRLTLTVTQPSSGLQVKLPITLHVEQPTMRFVESHLLLEYDEPTATDFSIAVEDPTVDVTFDIESKQGSDGYLTIDNSGRVSVSLDSDDLAERGVDVFHVIATRYAGQVGREVSAVFPVIIYRNVPDPLATTETESTEPTTTPYECVCTTETATECPTTVTVVTECPTQSTEPTETTTECFCPTTESSSGTTDCPTFPTTLESTSPDTAVTSDCPPPVTCPDVTTETLPSFTDCISTTDHCPVCETTTTELIASSTSSCPPCTETTTIAYVTTDCPTASTPFECPTTCPTEPSTVVTTECPETTVMSTECPTTETVCDCSTATTTGLIDTTIPSTQSTDTDTWTGRSSEGSTATDPPADSSTGSSSSTSADESTESTVSSSAGTSDCPTTAGTCPECPSTSAPGPECPTTSEPCPIECPSTSAPGPECPSTGAPCQECPIECPTTSLPCTLCPNPPEDEDCSTGGLIAAIAIFAVISVIASAAVAYLVYRYIYKKGGQGALNNLTPAGPEYLPTKPGDPELGNGNGLNSYPRKSFGSIGTMDNNGTLRSMGNNNNGDFKSSLGAGTISSSAPRGSIPTGRGFDPHGGAINSDVLSSPSSTLAPNIPLPVSYLGSSKSEPSTGNSYADPVYNYAQSGSDSAPAKVKSLETESVVDSLYATPASVASSSTRKSSLKAEPVEEPKVDYNRVTFGGIVETVIPPDDEDSRAEDTEGTESGANNETEEDQQEEEIESL